MTKITHAVIAAAAAVLLLAGCSSISAQPSAQVAPTASASPSSSPSAAPIPAQTSTSTPSIPASIGSDETPEEVFLRGIHAQWHGVKPSDDEFLSAGKFACDALRSGTARADIHAVEGSGADADWNNMRLVLDASTVLCP